LQFQAELPVKSPAGLHFLTRAGCLTFTAGSNSTTHSRKEGKVKKLQVRKTGPVRLTSNITPMYYGVCRF